VSLLARTVHLHGGITCIDHSADFKPSLQTYGREDVHPKFVVDSAAESKEQQLNNKVVNMAAWKGILSSTVATRATTFVSVNDSL
jgi:hypothetical protein